MSVRFVRGPRRWWVVAVVFVRVALAGVRRLGPLRLVRELRAYLRDNRNLLAGSSDRYVERDGVVYAATAMPPLSSPRFARYLLDEVVAFNARRPSPLLFALLSASSRCPYRCRYCYALGELTDRELVPLEVLERTIRGLGRKGVGSIFLTGGEVMYRAAELPGLLERTAGEVEAFWLVTTGWGVERALLESLLPHKLEGVVISLDGRDPGAVARLKGHRDAFANAVEAIRVAGELGLIVSVDCMVDEALLDDAEFAAFVAFLRELGVHFVNFFPPHLIGGAEKYDLPTLGDAELDRLEALMDGVNRGPAHAADPIAYSAVVWERRRGCTAGQQFLYVDPRGDVRPCPFLRLPAGNIVDEPIEPIVDRVRETGELGGCFGQYEPGHPSRHTG